MLAKNHKENDSAASKSSTPVTPEEEEEQVTAFAEQESLEMGAEPGTPITVGGDGSPL